VLLDAEGRLRCFACKGPYHPATGHIWTELPPDAQGEHPVYCGPCYRKWIKWMKGHLNRRWAGANFYEEAATSVRAGRTR
jgi:hypothetical protein